MSTLSSQKNSFVPRQGQAELIAYLPRIQADSPLSIQWPTGYGKSIGFALAWQYCQKNNIANRLLLVVANDIQRSQVINDFAGDCRLVGATCNGGVWSFTRAASDIRAAREKVAEVFVTTYQQLTASMRTAGVNTLMDLLRSPNCKWIVGFDEIHHLATDQPWGQASLDAIEQSAFCLGMSATPYRRIGNLVFPDPDLKITYQQAVDENSVKPMICKAYEYRVTVIDKSGEPYTYNVSELLELIKNDPDTPNDFNVWEERRGIRWSTQYLHPLITKPLTRLREKRTVTGKRLQMLVRAMSCEHAESVCKQIRLWASELSVDWVGSGPKGRNVEENRTIAQKFCPPKKGNQRPEPELDILVQVYMAGEGFDSINVCEIVDLFPVSEKAATGTATLDKQFYGRGSRHVADAPDLVLHINVPTDHPLMLHANCDLHKWMDSFDDSEDTQGSPREFDEDESHFGVKVLSLPKKRDINYIGEWNISEDDPHFKNYKHQLELNFSDFDPDNQAHVDKAKRFFVKHLDEQQRELSQQLFSNQMRSYIDDAIGKLALILAQQSEEINSATIGRFKKEVNILIKNRFGKSRDELLPEELEEVAQFLKTTLEARVS